jgi:hypothetical protein
VVGKNGANQVLTSTDGIIWSTQNASAVAEWQYVGFGNGLFVAVSATGSAKIMTSPDGVTWTTQIVPGGNFTGNVRGVAYGSGLYVAVASSGTHKVAVSPDGVNWTSNSGPTGEPYAIAYGNGLFATVKFTGDPVSTSPDGVTWTTQIVSASWPLITHAIALSLVYGIDATTGNGIFVAGTGSGSGEPYSKSRILISYDGVIWEHRWIPAAVTNMYAITHGSDKFLAIGDSGITLHSLKVK